ncbi:SAM-dependent methyltransferase [Bacillus phage vB_BanS_Nate]|uniref:Methyltransferase type 11 n=1 Tax=Bacillus phage vB_BanS_Nate TaxID=2894788 RepID=A0AAE8YXP6_9CAUD|nr:SAM-dependent methyltransferase [Bacillus phage vB_BanS_Nate]UGO50914.1 methyltransferase type 11 [Bacillus phage vB_BanS_Nate]
MKLDYGSGRQPKQGFKTSDFTGAPNYDFMISNYEVVGARKGQFEAIHVRNVLHHIPEKDLSTLFSEFSRLLEDGGELIISEPREEFHEQNKKLDWIWYRFLVNDTKIMIPNEYVDYKQYLVDFELVKSFDEYNNEVLTYKKIA